MATKLIICFLTFLFISTECYLRPQETATRQIKSLDGIWKFALAPEQGLSEIRESDEQVIKDVSIKCIYNNTKIVFKLSKFR